MTHQSKSYKKFVASAATATLVASALVPAASAATPAFTDVNSNYKEAVDYLVSKNITEGISETLFGTDAPIKRGDAAIFIARALNLDTTNAPDQDFTDVNSRVEGAVNAIVSAKIASGKTESTFAPDDYITRAEMSKILVNAYKLKAGDTKNTFTDVNNNWDEYVDALVASGVTLGLTETTFGATQDVTRGQFALFIHRAEHLEEAELEVKSATATDANTLAVTLSDDSTHTVKLDKALEANVETEVPFEIDGKEYTAKVTWVVAIVEPAVESVSAINAKQVQVTFSQPVDSLTALNKDNYKVQTNADAQPVALSTKDATAELDLSADGKTLTITTTTEINDAFKTGSAIVAGTPFKFTVDGVKAKDGSEIEAKTFTISSKDEVAPTFLTASAKAKTTTTRVTLEFNEPVDVAGAIAYVGGQAATVAQGSTPTTVVLTTAQALDAGKEYELTLLNFKDFAGNFLDKNPTNTKFTVTADAVAPVVQDVKVVRDNLVEVTFDKAMDATSFAGNARILDVNGVVQGGSLSASIKPGTAGKTVRLATASAVPFNEAGTFAGTLVLADSIKDASGNVKSATSHNITLTKDTVKPTVASASYVAPGAQYAGSTYANGAIVVKMSEEVSAANTPANFKLVSSTGVEVTSPAISAVAVNSLDAKEVILTMAGALPVDTYTVRVANEAVADLSTQANKNVAAVTTVKVDGSSDTAKPTVAIAASTPIVAATSQTSGSQIKLDMKDNVGLDLATVQNVTNYLLDGKPLPAGSYVTLAHNSSSSNSAATDITVTLNIPEKSIAKSANYTLNVNNIKDKAGNVAAPFVHSPVALVDDISPELTKAEISSNGLLVLTFSEAVNAVTTGTEADFEFTINGSTVAVASNTNIATFTDGTGTDTGKYVVTFKAFVDAGVDTNAATTADNRLFLDVNGDGAYTAGTDILLQTGTTTAVGAVATLDINMFSSLKVKVADTASVVKDTSGITSGPNPIKVGTTVTVK